MRRLGAVLAVLAPAALGSQQVLGPTADATVLPRGMLRVAVSPTWGRFHERFADGLGRTSKGTREPLAADFARDSIGVAQYQPLATVSTTLQSLLGGTGTLPLSIGQLQARFDASVATTPISVDFGISKRIMVSAVIPMVKTRTEVSLNPNPGGTTGNVGVNPAFFSANSGRSANAQVVAELTSAIQALQQQLTACSGSTAPSCSAINANRAGAQNLVTAATSAVAGIEGVYGVSQAKPGSRLAPVHRSTIQQAVEARLATLASSFQSFLGAPTGGSSWIAARPVGAPALAYADFQRLVTDSGFGVRADSLVSVEMNRLGDIELGGKVLLLDSFGAQQAQRARLGGVRFRLAVGGAYRLGTGVRDSVDHLADIGSGDGQRDLEGRVFLDLLFGSRLWTSVAARYVIQQADSLSQRVPFAPHEPFPLASRRVSVQRDLGDILAVEVSPRFVVSPNFALGATWQYMNKQADAYTSPGGVASTLDVSPLALGTARQEQRAFVSLTYSNMAQYFQGRARMPMEVSFTMGRTLSGNGNAPAQSLTALTLRVYNQLF